MTDEQLQQLHDRATRGEHLTPEEQSALEAWYARHDQMENQLLEQPERSNLVAELGLQVAAAAAQLETVTQHIRGAMAENQHLRDEVAALQRRLAQQMADRAA